MIPRRGITPVGGDEGYYQVYYQLQVDDPRDLSLLKGILSCLIII
jgi:hypothetical protein